MAKGEIDVALVWGSLAGFFAKRQATRLALAPVTPWLDGPQWPMMFDISMGTRKADRALRHDIEAALQRQAPAIKGILSEYGVPLMPGD